MNAKEYQDKVISFVKEYSPGQNEFYQAVTEVFESLTPLLEGRGD